jgi:hypothetical protein
MLRCSIAHGAWDWSHCCHAAPKPPPVGVGGFAEALASSRGGAAKNGIGEQLTADWIAKAGPEGKAVVDAYKK